jgi:ElaB/YqjD/DUF883 family membrane-anchored ribosome-binding protein
MNSTYETPDALRHDSQTLVNDARALLDATAEVADEKVTAARKRLASALESAKEVTQRIHERAMDGARQADRTIRSHPYESIAVALGLGALLGMAFGRRNH